MTFTSKFLLRLLMGHLNLYIAFHYLHKYFHIWTVNVHLMFSVFTQTVSATLNEAKDGWLRPTHRFNFDT